MAHGHAACSGRNTQPSLCALTYAHPPTFPPQAWLFSRCRASSCTAPAPPWATPSKWARQQVGLITHLCGLPSGLLLPTCRAFVTSVPCCWFTLDSLLHLFLSRSAAGGAVCPLPPAGQQVWAWAQRARFGHHGPGPPAPGRGCERRRTAFGVVHVAFISKRRNNGAQHKMC